MDDYDQALAAMDKAVDAVDTWCDRLRQRADQRLGIPPGTPRATADPWYFAALELAENLKSVRAELIDPRNEFADPKNR